MSDMHKINNMYRFSLNSYLSIFEKTLKVQRTLKSDTPEELIEFLSKK